MNLSNYFQILLLFAQLRHLYGTVTQSPSFACVGDSITVSCELTVPDAGAGDRFNIRRPSFIIGPTNTTITESTVIGTGTFNGFNLSRFTADINLRDSTEVSGSITLLSYINNTDEGLRLGCANDYEPGEGGDLIQLTQALTLVQAGLPSISTPIATIQNLNPSTCEGTLRFNLAATSDRDITSYSILLNGSSIEQNIAPSSTYDTNTIQFLLDINYPTSIIATSCAGNSNDGDASLRVNGYMQSDVSCTQYNNVTGVLTIDWTLNTPSQPTGVAGISIAYSVRVTYSHSNGTVTCLFTDTSNFNLMSTVTTYDVPLTAHNFTNPQRVETNITAHLQILQQCGQDLVGTELNCSLRSVTTNSPTTNPTNPPAAGLISAIIGGAVGGVITVLLILFILLLSLIGFIYLLKNKKKGLEGDKKKEFEFDQPHLGTLYAEVIFGNPAGVEKPEAIPETRYTEIDRTKTTENIYSTTSGVH